MKTHSMGNKIVWAIDPFEKNIKNQHQLIATLQRLSEKHRALIEPVYVLNFSLDEERGFKLAQHRFSEYKDAALHAIQNILEDLPSLQFLPPQVLMLEDSSPGKIAKLLVKYASNSHGLLIVTSTHARQGLPRLFLGSFTETLLLHSNLPVITVAPDCLPHSNNNQVLFATDFCETSHYAFKKLLQFAQASDLSITLFHSMSDGLEPVIQSGVYLMGGGWVPDPTYTEELENQNRKTAEEWMQEAHEMNVKMQIHFDRKAGNIADLILNYAKTQNFSWIAMAAESGLLKSSVIGSITRQVVRQATCPVWVLRKDL